MVKYYDWPRFLVAREGAINLDDQGFLVDPADEFGYIANPDAKAFEDLPDRPILVLLGEPGIGKSTLLDEATQTASQAGRHTIRFSLGEYGSEDRLMRALEEVRSQEFSKEGQPFDLLIDGLDEGLLSIPQLARVLGGSLAAFSSIPECRIRLSCRSAVWPETLEQRLKELWSADSVATYELAPLRRVDVETALRAESLDPEASLELIMRRGGGPLASRPITLRFLLKLLVKGQGLPSTRVELYRIGCTLLCAENNPDRRDSGRKGRLSPEQRLTVAARVAAVLMLANRDAVWIGCQGDRDSQSDVAMGQLFGRCLSPDGSPFDIGQDDLRETLDTGLFTGRGPSRLGFAHQTYAEFLAAHYLHQQRLPVRGKLVLLTSADQSEPGLVPQLAEVAAWSAAVDSQVLKAILALEPPVLLRSDLVLANTEIRRQLVDALLKLAERFEWSDSDWGIRSHYDKLCHPDLPHQLIPWIEDKGRFFVARRVAIDIAEACRLTDLQNVLCTVALDSSEDHHIRSQAAYALRKVGDPTVKLRLRPLLYLHPAEDPEEDLKGNALSALWPGALSTAELFACIGPPRQPSYLGIYRIFIHQELAPSLRPSDLPEALRWVREQVDSPDRDFVFDELRSEIILRAVEHVESPGVKSELALTIWSRLREFQDILSGTSQRQRKNLLDDGAMRRRVFLAILPLIQDPDSEFGFLVSSVTGELLRLQDVPWLIELARHSAFPTTRWTLGRLIDKTFSLDHLDDVMDACGADDVLRRSLPGLCRPMFLGSRRAKAARESHKTFQRLRALAPGPARLDPPPGKRVLRTLERIEEGQAEQFVQLAVELSLQPDSSHYEAPPLDLRTSPGWEEADEGTRTRIVNAAARFLHNGDPNLDDLLDTNRIPWACFAGLSALFVVESLEPESYAQLTALGWQRWGPVVLARFGDADQGHHEWAVRTLRRAYAAAPGAIHVALRRLIERDLKSGGYVQVARNLDSIWNDQIAGILLTSAKAFRDNSHAFSTLLQPLLEHRMQGALDYLSQILGALPVNRKSEEMATAISTSELLLKHATDAGWPLVWSAIQRDGEFGTSLVQAIADDFRWDGGWLVRVPEADLGCFFIWLEHEFPHAGDPKRDLTGRLHRPSWRFEVAEFRNKVLHALAHRGTSAAVAAIERICLEFPDVPWFRYSLARAREALRRHAWIPPSPSELLEVTTDSTKRLVRSDSELLDLVLESLERMQDRLQGANPIVRCLWDESNGYSRPKDENFLSDFVRDHLEQDLKQRGIAAQREVEIRRLKPRGLGERGDILVTASSRDHHGAIDSVAVVVESKGFWNPDLQTAIESQLVQRYLIDEGHRCGLYLVGWFNCDSWNDPDDWRREKAPPWSLEEARAHFSTQAKKLSCDTREIRAFVLNGGIPRKFEG